MDEFDQIVETIRKKLHSLAHDSCDRTHLMYHLRSLARWHEEPLDYPDVSDITFPEIIAVAYAVCHPECGVAEFIVDGSTQECQQCGGLLFRSETTEYIRADTMRKGSRTGPGATDKDAIQ